MLKTKQYEGRRLTEEEISLCEFYKQREIDQKLNAELIRQQHLQLAQLTSVVQEAPQRSFEARPEPRIEETAASVAAPAGEGRADAEDADGPASKRARGGDGFAFPDPGPGSGLLLSERWSAEEEARRKGSPKEFVLSSFGFDKCQTLVFRISVPGDSRRWSINIGPSSNKDLSSAGGSAVISAGSWKNILMHFNPRRERKRNRFQLLTNNLKDERWGLIETTVIDEDLLFGRTVELVIQILPDGFFVAVDGAFCCVFAHRANMTTESSLCLQIPIVNDYGDAEKAVFEKIWWGKYSVLPCFLDPSVMEKLTKGSKDATRKRTCYVSGLPRTDDPAQIEEISELLLTLFEAYSPVDFQMLPGRGQAYITVESDSLAKDAIEALHGSQVEFEGGEELQISVDYSRNVAE